MANKKVGDISIILYNYKYIPISSLSNIIITL